MNSDRDRHEDSENTPSAGDNAGTFPPPLTSSPPPDLGYFPSAAPAMPAASADEGSLQDLFLAGLVILLIQVLIGAVWGIGNVLIHGPEEELDVTGLLPYTTVVFFLSILWTAYHFRCRKYGRTFVSGLAVRSVSKRCIATSLALAVGLFFLAMLFTVFRHVYDPAALDDAPITRVMSSSRGLIMFMFIALLAPPFEELFFRGFMYPVLAYRWGATMAVVATSLVFGLAHAAQLGNDIPAVMVILLLGVVLTLQRRATGSVVPGLITHWVYNGLLAGLMLVSLLLPGLPEPGPPATHPTPPDAAVIQQDLIGRTVGDDNRGGWHFDNLEEFEIFDVRDIGETSTSLTYYVYVELDGSKGPDATADLNVLYDYDETGYTLTRVTDDGTLTPK